MVQQQRKWGSSCLWTAKTIGFNNELGSERAFLAGLTRLLIAQNSGLRSRMVCVPFPPPPPPFMQSISALAAEIQLVGKICQRAALGKDEWMSYMCMCENPTGKNLFKALSYLKRPHLQTFVSGIAKCYTGNLRL